MWCVVKCCVWCNVVSGVKRCLMCNMWCVVCGVWCVVCGVWCVVCGVWCVVCGVYYVVCGVWCVVCGELCEVCGVVYSVVYIKADKHSINSLEFYLIRNRDINQSDNEISAGLSSRLPVSKEVDLCIYLSTRVKNVLT